MTASASRSNDTAAPGQLQWYAIYVGSRAEKKVDAALNEKGMKSFLPLKKSLRKWSDRRKWVDMPLIPGYCFVRIDIRNYIHVLQTNHVVGFVRFEGKPAVIRDQQIEFLKRMLKQSDYTWEITHEEFTPGQKVEIIAGPFIGLEAELISIKGKKRVVVRIEQISNTLIIDIPQEDITAVG